jgi:hypothetical protein
LYINLKLACTDFEPLANLDIDWQDDPGKQEELDKILSDVSNMK